MKRAHIILLLAVLGCGEQSPTGTGGQALLFGGWTPGAGLVRCAPIARDSVSQTIGPLGGTVRVGPHWLTIPPGALDSAVEITAIAPSDTVNLVDFGPAGLSFHTPATLTMSYANCGWLATVVPKHIAYTSDALLILELLPSLDDLATQRVTARLDHFSDYAIAW